MPLLANLLIYLFGGIASFLTKYLSKRFLYAGVYVAAVSGLTATAYLAIRAGASAILLAVPPNLYIASTWVVPDNWSECVGALIASEIVMMTYRYTMNLQLAVLAKA